MFLLTFPIKRPRIHKLNKIPVNVGTEKLINLLHSSPLVHECITTEREYIRERAKRQNLL